MSNFKIFHKGINDTITEFQRNPFNFLYEIDIQAFLFASIYKELRGESLQLKGGYHPQTAYPDHNSISTVPIKCEYPSSKKFDIAIIDDERLKHFDRQKAIQEEPLNDFFWNQPVIAAIEIKYLQLGDSVSKKIKGLKDDAEKLSNHREKNRPFLGIALLFVQSKQFVQSILDIFKEKCPVFSDENLPEDGVFSYIVTPQQTRLCIHEQ